MTPTFVLALRVEMTRTHANRHGSRIQPSGSTKVATRNQCFGVRYQPPVRSVRAGIVDTFLPPAEDSPTREQSNSYTSRKSNVTCRNHNDRSLSRSARR